MIGKFQNMRPIDQLIEIEEETARTFRDFFVYWLGVSTEDIDEAELRCFSASLIGFQVFRKYDQADVAQVRAIIDDLFGNLRLDGQIRHTNGMSSIQLIQCRWAEYSKLIPPAFIKEGEPEKRCVTLVLHAFEKVTGQSAWVI